MSKRLTNNPGSGRRRLPMRPVRLSKEELEGSRAGTLGCFPSPDLYVPEDEPRERKPGTYGPATPTGVHAKHRP